DDHEMEDEARMVYGRATCIRIPQPVGERLVAEYALHHSDGKFADVEVVPESRPAHQGSSRTFRLPVFDLSVAHRCCKYDKSGSKALVRTVKFCVFGSSNYRLNRERCERFFEDDANFVFTPLKTEQEDNEPELLEPEPEIIIELMEGPPVWPPEPPFPKPSLAVLKILNSPKAEV